MFKHKISNRRRIIDQIKKTVPNIEREVSDSTLMSAKEVADLAGSYAPKRTGDYARSITAKPTETKDGSPAAGVFADFIWRWLEHGTAPHGNHPGTAAQPHLFPAYRTLRKRIKSRTSRAINKAVKKATGG